MKYKYKTIDTRTLKGIRSAENHLKNGWKIISNGINNILMEKEV